MIVISYAAMSDAEARTFTPKVVHVDRMNKIISLGDDPAEPAPGTTDTRGDHAVLAEGRDHAHS